MTLFDAAQPLFDLLPDGRFLMTGGTLTPPVTELNARLAAIHGFGGTDCL